MAFTYKILTQNGVDNTNIDGARAEYFAAGMRDGIIKGSLNECAFTVIPSNGINLDTGVLLVAGHPIVITEGRSWTFTSRPSSSERRAVIAEITVDNNRSVAFRVFEQLASIALVKNNMYEHENGSGTYQVEIGRFTLTTSGLVEDVVRTLDLITGGGTADSELRWGTITTNTLGHNVPAEADFEQRYDEEQGHMVTDVTLGIPSGSIDNLDETLSTTSHNAIENQAVANALANRYTKAEANDLLDTKADLRSYTQNFWAKSVNVGGTNSNYLWISTPDSTGTYIFNPSNDINIRSGQSDAPNKNIILNPSGRVICLSDLKFASGHTAKVPTPTANEDATPKSYVDAILPIGALISYAGKTVPNHYLWCDGSTFDSSRYPELYAVLGSTTLPDMRARFSEGAGNLSEVGTTVNPGLPNITGSFTANRLSIYEDNSAVLSGAFNNGIGQNTGSGQSGADFDSTRHPIIFNFNASKSNTIYGGSTTVQPNSYKVMYIIKAE